MATFIRKSKFRHVFGTSARKENSYEGFTVTNSAFEGTFIAANGKFLAFCVEVGGGGSFVVLPVEKKGRLDVDIPKINAHVEYVLDLQWNPYNDNMIASCSEDGSIKLWEFPDDGIVTDWDDSKALCTLDYHEKRCVQIQWHPIASSVLLSVSQEPKLCIWHLDDGVVQCEIVSPDIIYNASWSMKGDKIVTSCKDKKFRIYNARTGVLIVEGDGHEGSKPQRVIFTMNDKYLFSCGFSRMSERQYCCWSANSIAELNLAELDTANGCLIPYYDPDTQIVYIAARGDSVIRYYELVDEDPYFHYITTFSSTAAQRGLAPIPKRSISVNDHEIMRFYKLHGSKAGYVEPISMTVPRKSDIYQDDLYPDAIGPYAGLEASEWFEGTDKEPFRIDMSTKFVGKVSKKAAAGGGLKKGGLKGLKAKKDAKVAAKAANADTLPHDNQEEETPTQETIKETAHPPASAPVKQTPPSSVAAAPTVDAKIIDDLKNEIKELKERDKKREEEITSLIDRLRDYEKSVGDMKLLSERIAAIEALTEET